MKRMNTVHPEVLLKSLSGSLTQGHWRRAWCCNPAAKELGGGKRQRSQSWCGGKGTPNSLGKAANSQDKTNPTCPVDRGRGKSLPAEPCKDKAVQHLFSQRFPNKETI